MSDPLIIIRICKCFVRGIVVVTTALTFFPISADAQSLLDSGFTMEEHPTITDGYTISWFGDAEAAYFLESSSNLSDWVYVPSLASGLDASIEYGFVGTPARWFYRLHRFEHGGENPFDIDLDHDGVSNGDELTVGANLLDSSDGDTNGQSDDYEAFYSSFTPAVVSPDSDTDGDGFTNMEEYLAGTDPNSDTSTPDYSVSTGLQVHTPLN